MLQPRLAPLSTGIPDPLKSNLTATGEKKVYPRDSVRLFESDLLEKFTHVHPIVPLLIWAPVVAILIYRSLVTHGNTVLDFLGYGFLGLIFWTFIEYTLHRFVFHYPAKSALGNRLVYLMHGLHHEDPADPTRLVMPPAPAAIYALILFPTFRYFLGPVHVEAFIAFFVLGYLAYDYIHYFVHHFTPRTPVGKFLKKHHLMHHFADYESKWGVSNPLWDYIFGTVVSKGESKDRASRIKTA
jgi:sterol desaturase/sphingolipid hydroxylase (fatty acid hydroxylase superfamily)